MGFLKDSMMEVAMIMELVYTLTSSGASNKESFRYLLKNDIILLEEIRDIEHLILFKLVSKLLQEHQDHARAVLLMQHYWRHW